MNSSWVVGKPYLTGLGKDCPLSAHDQQATTQHMLLVWRFHTRVGLPMHFSQLAVFDPRLDIRVRRIDEPA
jgi:hypothetical protein